MWGWVGGVVRRFWHTIEKRLLSRQEWQDAVDKGIDTHSTSADVLATSVARGEMLPANFEEKLRERLRKAYMDAYEKGIGGRNQMGPPDYGSIGGMLAEQYKYLKGFVAEIAAGNLTEEQIIARTRMYVNSSREGFERARERNAKGAGMTEELWVLDTGVENCTGCQELAAQGWVPMNSRPNRPGDGRTPCRTNCHCKRAFRNPETGKMY